MRAKLIITIYFIAHQFILTSQIDSSGLKLISSLPSGTEVAIGIYNNGNIQKYGWKINKGHLKYTENSSKLFELGSITKVFTSLSALKVLQKHKINYHTSITNYLPNNDQMYKHQISFYQLMTHTSGLPKMPNNFIWSIIRCPSDPFLHYDKKKMIRYIYKFTPSKNSSFKYSNLGMGLLGYLLTQIENKSLDSLMKTEIFQPLDMDFTSLGLTRKQFKHVVGNNAVDKEPKRTWKFSNATKGAGNLYSNVDDMIQFLHFIFHPSILQNEISALTLHMEKEQLRINETERMGLGFRIYKSGNTIHYHGGITSGFKSLLAYNRHSEKGIIILTNAKGLSRKENTILKQVCINYLSQDLMLPSTSN